MKKQLVIGISGFKNSGKTTLISNIIPKIKEIDCTLKVATIKHDGHDFAPDVRGTDTYIHRKSGADAVAIFSNSKYMVIKDESVDVPKILEFYKDMDIVLLEGFKSSKYQKIEILRDGISEEPYCNNVLAYVSDFYMDREKVTFDLEDYEKIGKFIVKMYNEL